MEQQKSRETQQKSQVHAPKDAPKADAGERQVYRCANCEIEFFWSPTIVRKQIYCCTGCAAGGPCNCDYSLYRSVTIMGVIHYE
jgi:hypothetical protein